MVDCKLNKTPSKVGLSTSVPSLFFLVLLRPCLTRWSGKRVGRSLWHIRWGGIWSHSHSHCHRLVLHNSKRCGFCHVFPCASSEFWRGVLHTQCPSTDRYDELMEPIVPGQEPSVTLKNQYCPFFCLRASSGSVIRALYVLSSHRAHPTVN